MFLLQFFFSAPHVTGALSLLWRRCPACPRTDVYGCTIATATDAGPPGKDIYFGWGVLNTAAALTCITGQTCCQDSDPVAAQIPLSPSPTKTPTQMPSLTPSNTPTSKPTDAPTTKTPTSQPTLAPTSGVQLCLRECEEKDKFCRYASQVSCAEENTTCVQRCDAAVVLGELEEAFKATCQTEWCVQNHDSCVAGKNASCTAQAASCQQLCNA